MPTPPPALPVTDLDALARTIDGEAAAEPRAGKEAVAAVAANRLRLAQSYVAAHPGAARHPTFGEPTWRGICLACWRDVYQFSCWEEGSFDRQRILEATDAQLAVETEIARRAIAGALADPTGGATHYLNIDLEQRLYGRLPGWIAAMRQTAVIGRHTFFQAKA
ncbi:MAG: cell wall hydrolase [Magnetospirillum sp.]|nr:cell wall hydrolase [Magnetospirillum sp.]